MSTRARAVANREFDREGHLVFALAGSTDAVSDELAPDTTTAWGRLVRIAAEESALLALRDYLQPGKGRGIPSELARQLAIHTLRIEARMDATRRRLEDLLVALNAVGIVPLLLKGGALAATVYAGWRERPMRDVDLLVAENQLEAARAVALAGGWIPEPSLPGDLPYATHHHLTPFTWTGGDAAHLEIHRSLLPVGHPFTISRREVSEHAEPVNVGAGRAVIMRRHHHAVYIAAHFVWSHQVHTGAWHAFRDLAAISKRGGLDWCAFATTAERWGAASCAYWLLRLGRSLARLVVPADIIEQLRPRMPETVLSQLERHFTAQLLRSEQACPSVTLERALWSLAIQPRRSGHRRIRPWTVSIDLLAERARQMDPGTVRAPLLVHMKQCSRYLASCVG